MSDTTYTKLFSGNFIIVQMAIDRLSEAGINAIVKDESESGRLAGFGASIQGHQELYVRNEELAQAQIIITAINNDLKLQDN